MPSTAPSQAEAYQRRPGRAVAERSRSRRPSAAVERPKGQMLTRGSVPKIRPSRARSCLLLSCPGTACTSSHHLLKIWAR